MDKVTESVFKFNKQFDKRHEPDTTGPYDYYNIQHGYVLKLTGYMAIF